MKDSKLHTISNLFEGNEIRSVWNSEKEDYSEVCFFYDLKNI